jgi:hypothetical protein
LDLLTARIENGRTARRLYKGNIRVMLRSPPSFLKQLHHIIFAFGKLSLACPGLTVTSMCCSDHHCLRGWLVEKLLLATMGYYLVDGIYPPWATFVSTISNPVGQKKSHFAHRQEAARKDVERTSGVLQAHFAVVHAPAKQ